MTDKAEDEDIFERSRKANEEARRQEALRDFRAIERRIAADKAKARPKE